MSENISKPSEPPNNEPAPETAWTIMVYLAGDNNLADECVFALTEMKAAMVDSRIKVVAQFDPTARRVRTRRFVLNRLVEEENQAPREVPIVRGPDWKYRRPIIDDAIEGLPPGRVRFPGAVVPSRGSAGAATAAAAAAAAVAPDPLETDCGDPALLFDFISWTVDNHPADHYMIILSGHGSGVLEQEFLRDESSQGTLTIKELGEVFKAVKTGLKDKQGRPLEIDVVGLDTCVMSMAEVVYELYGNVKYMVSSESYGPQSGWPYGRIIERLSKTLAASEGKASAEQLGMIAVDEHVDFYFEYAVTNGLSVDISLIDVSRAGDLVTVVKTLSDVLIEALGAGAQRKLTTGSSDFLDQIVLAHWEAQSYNGELYVDLQDFCECLRRRYQPDLVTPVADGHPQKEDVDAEIQRRRHVVDACDAVIKLVSSALVKQSCFMGVTYQYSFGVSIYLPWAEVAPDYDKEQLAFIGPSGWREFLEAYVTATRRQPRGFTIEPTVFLALETTVRKTTTDDKGPTAVPIRSMRNPPIDVVEGGLSICTQSRLDGRVTP